MWEIQGAIWIIIAFYLIGDLLLRLLIETPFILKWGLSSEVVKAGYWIMFSIWGFLLVYFSASTILSRALIKVDGTIIESKKEPYFPDQLRETRYACIYTIESSSGDGNFQYIAHQNDSTLAQDLSIGTQIEKKKWEITYKLNNEIIEDFPTQHYINTGCLGVLLVLINLIRICYHYWVSR